MWQVEKNFKVKLGGNYFVNCESLISFRDEPLFRLYRRDSDGQLGIDFDLYDKQGAKIATIRNSNVVEGDHARYQITRHAEVKRVIEQATGREIVRIDKRPETPIELDVTLHTYLPGSGFLLQADPEKINIAGCLFVGNVFESQRTGIAIGGTKGGAGIRLAVPG